ncbi:MAG TPA: ABC transporter permease, partial [Vicinamibacterales bacterium]
MPVETLAQDVRYAARMLVKNPGFALLTVLCLSLGIGVDSTIFSIVDAIAIRPLPFRDPDRLQFIGMSQLATARDFGAVSYLDFRELRDHATSFSALACDAGRSAVLSDGDEPERLVAGLVSANMFPTLGIEPVLGRQFSNEEDRQGGAPVVLLSFGIWQRRYVGDPSIVGRTVTLDGAPTTVVGVMPPRFQFPENADLWIPAAQRLSTEPRGNRDLEVTGRLKPGVTVAAARQELSAIGKRLSSTYPEDKDQFVLAQSMREAMIPDDVRLIVYTMLGAVTCVLLIARGNVANLLLARATVRQREIAVRAAIGAGRLRIVRQMVTESVLIGLASAPLGVVLAYVGLRWLSASIPPGQVPYYINWDLNGRVVAYTVVVAVVTGLVFGLAPALQAARRDLFDSLKDAARGSTEGGRRSRLRNALVMGEIALAVVVLVGASLFVRTFKNFENARAGLPTKGLITMRVFLTGDRYATPDSQYQRAQDLVQRVEAIPGVAAAMASLMAPFGMGGSGGPVVAEGGAVEKGKEPNVLYF